MSTRPNTGLSPNVQHWRSDTLSLARSPSHKASTTVPESEYFPAHQAKSRRTSSDEDADEATAADIDEARGLVEEMDILDGHEQGFDRPDRAEMGLILGSTAMVILVAVAAGLTTIYDWVL